MSISRRSVLGVMAAVGPAIIVRRVTAAQAEGAQIAPGPFHGTRESLKDYQVPNWMVLESGAPMAELGQARGQALHQS